MNRELEILRSVCEFFKNKCQGIRFFIVDLLFPIECLGCGKYGRWVCIKCLAKIKFTAGQSCPACKAPAEYGEFCPTCRKNFFLDGIMVAGDYRNPLLAKLIKQMKYHFTREIAELLGDFLVLFLRDLANRKSLSNADIFIGSIWRRLEEIKNAPPVLNRGATVIIPVPLHKKRLRWRGYNQAEELGKRIACRLGYEMRTNEIARKKYRTPQAKLSHEDRLHNIAGCFRYSGAGLNGLNAILIDDVATTASTLNECAKILKQNGANQVWGLVAAKG